MRLLKIEQNNKDTNMFIFFSITHWHSSMNGERACYIIRKIIFNACICLNHSHNVNIKKVKSQDEKPKYQSFTLGPPFYKQMAVVHGIFDETLVDYI